MTILTGIDGKIAFASQYVKIKIDSLFVKSTMKYHCIAGFGNHIWYNDKLCGVCSVLCSYSESKATDGCLIVD